MQFLLILPQLDFLEIDVPDALAGRAAFHGGHLFASACRFGSHQGDDAFVRSLVPFADQLICRAADSVTQMLTRLLGRARWL